MSSDEQMPTSTPVVANEASEDVVRSEKILKAKELYSHGSRNFLVKSFGIAADELSQVCTLYEELYGDMSDELGMPYLLYAKSLIALALDENKVIDVPDEEEDDDDDDDDDEEGGEVDNNDNDDGKEGDDENSNSDVAEAEAKPSEVTDKTQKEEVTREEPDSKMESIAEEAPEDSSNEAEAAVKDEPKKAGKGDSVKASVEEKNGATSTTPMGEDDELPSTSNGNARSENIDKEEDEENEAATTLQLAWEILELAAKIFSRQGLNGLPNLAEVQTELANIEFENSIPEAARGDYEKALKIYESLPNNYRRAMAEIHYKIGLTYLLQTMNKEAAEALKEACTLIDQEISEMNEKKDLSEKDKNNIQDMEETKQEIWVKITEIEETQAQNIAEVRAALDSYIKPISSTTKTGDKLDGTEQNGASSSSSASASKPKDISHLIKRKRVEETVTAGEPEQSPAKRPMT